MREVGELRARDVERGEQPIEQLLAARRQLAVAQLRHVHDAELVAHEGKPLDHLADGEGDDGGERADEQHQQRRRGDGAGDGAPSAHQAAISSETDPAARWRARRRG